MENTMGHLTPVHLDLHSIKNTEPREKDGLRLQSSGFFIQLVDDVKEIELTNAEPKLIMNI